MLHDIYHFNMQMRQIYLKDKKIRIRMEDKEEGRTNKYGKGRGTVRLKENKKEQKKEHNDVGEKQIEN